MGTLLLLVLLLAMLGCGSEGDSANINISNNNEQQQATGATVTSCEKSCEVREEGIEFNEKCDGIVVSSGFNTFAVGAPQDCVFEESSDEESA